MVCPSCLLHAACLASATVALQLLPLLLPLPLQLSLASNSCTLLFCVFSSVDCCMCYCMYAVAPTRRSCMLDTLDVPSLSHQLRGGNDTSALRYEIGGVTMPVHRPQAWKM